MSTKNNENTELAESLLKFTTYHFIEDSKLNLKLIEKRIQFYQNLIGNLRDEKPLFFQKGRKKLKCFEFYIFRHYGSPPYVF